jgi:uncharacterized protein (TIGR03083 family)
MRTMDEARRITRAEAPAIAAAEYDRFLALLQQLGPDDWAQPTDCDEWDVRAMVAHVLGACEGCASVREMVHQTRLGKRAAKRRGGADVDGINEVQVRERAHLTPPELLARLRSAAPRAVRGRRRLPSFLRGVDVGDAVIGPLPLGHLMDVVYTRDTWLHRVDISRATGRPLELTGEHDGRIVADVIGEWAALHGQPFELRLTGPAGGRYRQGAGGPVLELDAVELCRVLSGRVRGEGLLAVPVVF